MIETFVSWFLGVISNGIGEKSKRKREIKNLQDSTRQEVVREVKNDLLACIEEMNEQFKDFEKLREKGFHSSCDEFIEFCNQYIEDHSYHTAKYKKLEMDLPDDGGLDELLQIVKMEKFCLDITSKNVMSDVYFQTLDEEKKNNILEEFRMMSFKYSELYSKYDSAYLKRVLSTYVNGNHKVIFDYLFKSSYMPV